MGSKNQTFECEDCGTQFGSNLALKDHQARCPQRLEPEARRVRDALYEIERRIRGDLDQVFKYAARGFDLYHNERWGDQLDLMVAWAQRDHEDVGEKLTELMERVVQVARTDFPRLERLRSELRELKTQWDDAQRIVRTLVRVVKKR